MKKLFLSIMLFMFSSFTTAASAPRNQDLITTLESAVWVTTKWYGLPGGIDVPVKFKTEFKNQVMKMSITCFYKDSVDHYMSKNVTVERVSPVRYTSAGILQTFEAPEVSKTISENGKQEKCVLDAEGGGVFRYSFKNTSHLLVFQDATNGYFTLQRQP